MAKKPEDGKAEKAAPKVDKSPEAAARAEKAQAAKDKAAAKKKAEAGDKKPRVPYVAQCLAGFARSSTRSSARR